jgi:hypothetical protein
MVKPGRIDVASSEQSRSGVSGQRCGGGRHMVSKQDCGGAGSVVAERCGSRECYTLGVLGASLFYTL